MRRLPTGTITFLFTDIESSTSMVGRLGDSAYSDVLAAHHRLLRSAFRKWEGREIDTKGDSFLVAFRHAKSAMAAAIAAQISVLTSPWPQGGMVRVRMGLHTGEPVSAKIGYVGIDLHRAARVCAAGHGGQILMSETTRLIVEDSLPRGVSLRDLGEHRLPGLARPQRLFQVVSGNLPSDFPPLKTLVAFPNNLPAQLTSFVGRAKELSEVKRMLSATRLLTLTGTGGAGKTRLALQLAKEVLPQFNDGVWLVELTSLSEPGLVAQTVASILSVRERRGQPIQATLVNRLQNKHLLLVLDNCEHLIAACASLAADLLQACPNLRILATSRESLKVAGESRWRVPSLSLPNLQRLPPPEDLLCYEGIRLFVERAKTMLPSFSLTTQNASHVVQICRRLDGIPLAIELAAARVRVLSVDQIAHRLDDRFHLLTNGSRTAPRRAQTLEAAMDWSFSLLSESEQAAMRRLSVFAGGFTLEAAEAICAGHGIEPADILDLLTHLVDKSLVMVDERGGEARFRLLETVRQFAWTRLLQSGELASARKRHRDWYLALAERAEPEFYGMQQLAWYDRLEVEHDNLREALEWSLRDAEQNEAVRLAGALYRFWHVRGYHTEGRRWLERTLAVGSGASALAHAKALYAAGSLAHVQDDATHAMAMAQASYDIYEELGHKQGTARSAVLLGFVAMDQGNYELARTHLQQGLGLSQELEDKLGVGYALNLLGEVARCQGDYIGARSLYEQALPVWRELRDERGVAVVLDNLGRVAGYLGDYGQAETLLSEALQIRRKLGFTLGVATTLAGLAGVAAAQMRADRAARLLGAAAALLSSLGASLYRADRLEYDRTVASVHSALGEARYKATLDEGKRMTLDQAIEFTMATDA